MVNVAKGMERTGMERSGVERSETKRIEARQFQVLMVLCFALFLPVVFMSRILKLQWHGRRLPAAPRQRESIISETKAEVKNALAFVFMA